MHCHGTDPWRNGSEKVGLPFQRTSKEIIFSRLKQMVEELRTKGVGVCNAASWIIAVDSHTVSGALQDHWQFSPTITTFCRSLSLGYHFCIPWYSEAHHTPGPDLSSCMTIWASTPGRCGWDYWFLQHRTLSHNASFEKSELQCR